MCKLIQQLTKCDPLVQKLRMRIATGTKLLWLRHVYATLEEWHVPAPRFFTTSPLTINSITERDPLPNPI
jgi:hypothetical protein